MRTQSILRKWEFIMVSNHAHKKIKTNISVTISNWAFSSSDSKNQNQAFIMRVQALTPIPIDPKEDQTAELGRSYPGQGTGKGL